MTDVQNRRVEELDGRALHAARVRSSNHDRLVEAALQLLSEGACELSAKSVAQRAKVSVATVYNHFPDRVEGILRAVLEQFRSDAVAAAERALATAGSAAALRELCGELVARIASLGDSGRMLLREGAALPLGDPLTADLERDLEQFLRHDRPATTDAGRMSCDGGRASVEMIGVQSRLIAIAVRGSCATWAMTGSDSTAEMSAADLVHLCRVAPEMFGEVAEQQAEMVRRSA
mgnify:FL=1